MQQGESMVWMFLVGCLLFGVAWLVQECKKVTDEEVDETLERWGMKKFLKLANKFIELSKEMSNYLVAGEQPMLPKNYVKQYLKARDELFAYMENNPYLPQDVVESVYSVNRANNDVFRAFDIDINVGA